MSLLRCPGVSPRTVAEPALQRQEAEEDAEERRLAGSVRPEHGDELARLDRQVDAAPDRPGRRSRRWRPAARRRACRSSPGRPVQRGDQALELGRPATARSSSVAGERVSVTVATGMCAARARSFAWSTSGVTFWLLKTQTLTSWRRSCRSTVSLSRMLTSPPSATALAKPGGVQQPQAEARAERLEDALAVADGHAGEAAADLGAQRVVASERLGLEPTLPGREVAGVRRVGVDVRGGDRCRRPCGQTSGEYHWCGLSPFAEAEHVADRDDRAAAAVGREEPGGPGVVADPVDDRDLRAGERSGVGGRRLVAVRVGRRIGDHAAHLHAIPAELGGDAAPHVLGGATWSGCCEPAFAAAGNASHGEAEREEEAHVATLP